LVKNVK